MCCRQTNCSVLCGRLEDATQNSLKAEQATPDPCNGRVLHRYVESEGESIEGLLPLADSFTIDHAKAVRTRGVMGDQETHWKEENVEWAWRSGLGRKRCIP